MKQKYIELLGLSKQFTKEELLVAFTSHASEVTSDNELYILNEAYHYLISYCKRNIDNNSNKIYTESLCEKIGMSINEANLVFAKLEKYDTFKSLDDYIIRTNNLYKLFNEKKSDYISLMAKEKELSTIPYDRIFNMYNNDLLLNSNEGYDISFDSYLYTLSSLLKSASKLGGISLESEYKEFMSNDGIFFLEYVVDKVSIKYYLSKLGKEEYVERHNYEYGNNSSLISFAEYLREMYSVKVLMENVKMKEEELEECFKSYKELGYGNTKIEFLKEYNSVKEYCLYLPSMYFALKSSYNTLTKENKALDFITYVRLEQARVETGLSYSKMIEIMYMRAKKNGFNGTIEDYIYYMIGYTTVDKNNKKLILN